MSSTNPTPDWQTSLDPALVRRLHREPGILSRALARRIVGWVDYFARRTGAFVDLLRRRGRAGALRTDEVPIVHARWAEEPEPTCPVEAPSSIAVVVRAAPSAAREIPNARPTPTAPAVVMVAAPETRSLPPHVTAAQPAAPHRGDRVRENTPIRSERGKGPARVEGEDAVLIHLPPARRAARGAPRLVQLPAEIDAPPPAAPPREASPSAQPALPRVEPARASASLPAPSPASLPPREAVSPAALPRPMQQPVIVTQRPRTSATVAGNTTPSPIVATKRPVAAAPVPRVEARRARPSPPRAAATARVAPSAALPPTRAALVHATPVAPVESPREQAPSPPAAPRPAPVPRTPPATAAAPASDAPSRAPESPRPARPSRRELDVDTLVDTVERRILKNLAVERERKGGRG
jgi:hypothetical protein